MAELLLKDEVYAVIGAALEVYKEMGTGFLEGVYQEVMGMELGFRGIPFEPQKPLEIYYKGVRLTKEYIPDFICYGQLIVELKALDSLSGKEESQLLNYLKATKMRVGLLVNFGSKGSLEWQRFVY